jgi:hypothetical protein
MKNVYLIFPNPSDVYSNVTITCTREKLNDVLIEIELLEEDESYKDCSWVIFENGIMIQG